MGGGGGIKCLIYAVEGTPGLGEELKGKGPRAEAQGAESCQWPSVLKAVRFPPPPPSPRPLPPEGTRLSLDPRSRGFRQSARSRTVLSLGRPCNCLLFPREERVSGKGSWTFRERQGVSQ